MVDDYYEHPYVIYSLNTGPTVLDSRTHFTFFTDTGRVHVRVVGRQKLPKRRWYRKSAKVLVEIVEQDQTFY